MQITSLYRMYIVYRFTVTLFVVAFEGESLKLWENYGGIVFLLFDGGCWVVATLAEFLNRI